MCLFIENHIFLDLFLHSNRKITFFGPKYDRDLPEFGEKADTRGGRMKITEEEWQVVYYALGCVGKESTCTITNTLVDCAKQIVNLHMNKDLEIDIEYNSGILQIAKPERKVK